LIENHQFKRLALAALAGIILGFPSRLRPGGIRTHMMVTLGAAIFTGTALHFGQGRNEQVLRVVQGIASGIGFVGAATVMREGGNVRGISTAASIWVAAALGCEAGLASPVVAVVIALIVVILSEASGAVENAFFRRRRTTLPPPQTRTPTRAGAGGG
jgi:putative Mg2+ transporter-C (MgtC) family protein